MHTLPDFLSWSVLSCLSFSSTLQILAISQSHVCSQVDVSCVLVNVPPSTEGATRTTGYVALSGTHRPGRTRTTGWAARSTPAPTTLAHDQVTPVGATSGGSGNSADRTSESRNTCVARSLARTFLSCPRSLDSTSEVHTWESAPAHIPTFL